LSSPFNLYIGDHSRLVLVSIPLTRNNYNTWSRSMSTTLIPKTSFLLWIDLQLRPKSDDLLFEAWVHCNNMVIRGF
ncbi:hypothetical protein F511_33044, partial [Dorcoceras hygrometricum]